MRVLESFRTPRPTTNPYIVMLRDSLRAHDQVDVIDFSWRAALLGHYDVIHLHWPEILVGGRSSAGEFAHQMGFFALVLRAWLCRIPIVRTQHNLDLPSGLSRRARLLLGLGDRLTTLRVTLNRHTDTGATDARVIVHGHYRDWYRKTEHYADSAAAERVPGRVLLFGLIRTYKGWDVLVRAFTALAPDAGLSLRIAGKPSTDAVDASLRAAAQLDPRISLRLEFLDDSDLVREVSQADLVVLPYPRMHNSGAALAALSLGRPVLVPDNPVNRDLSDEVGPGWVYLFDGIVGTEDLAAAAQSARDSLPGQPPDLSAREWQLAGSDHAIAFAEAMTAAHRIGRWQRLRGRTACASPFAQS